MGINRFLTRIGRPVGSGALVALILTGHGAFAQTRPMPRPETAVRPAVAQKAEAAPKAAAPAEPVAKPAIASLRPRARPEIAAIQDASFEKQSRKAPVAAEEPAAPKKIALKGFFGKKQQAEPQPEARPEIEVLRARGLAATTAKKQRGQRIWCVDFARAATGVQIQGNAKTWWDRAKGLYDRGRKPKVGAVMAFRSTKGMPMGHVAVVSEVVSERKILIDHANWKRNQISLKMTVVDVSKNNDWTAVRLESLPNTLGSVYPINGFIYRGEG